MMPFERRSGRKTVLFKEAGIHILGVQTLNVEKTNIIEKGLGQVMLEAQFKAALKKYLGHVRFDLILYSTPPITFAKVIEYAKRQNPQAVSYLMLKDIFPQNAVDLGLLKKNGLKGMLYRSFRKKEKKLYAISGVIGCMSPANVKFILAHNPEIKPEKVEIVEQLQSCCIDFTLRRTTSRDSQEVQPTYRLSNLHLWWEPWKTSRHSVSN